MKKADLYEIVIKILGLYLVVIIINQLRDIMVYLNVLIQSKNNPEMFNYFNHTSVFLVYLIGFLILISFSGVLVFKTKRITKMICRPTDYKEQLMLVSEKQTIYEICLVLIGLVTIVMILPDFIFKLKNQITLSYYNFPTNDYDTTFLVTSGLKIAIGLIAIINSRKISKLLAKKKRENIDHEKE